MPAVSHTIAFTITKASALFLPSPNLSLKRHQSSHSLTHHSEKGGPGALRLLTKICDLKNAAFLLFYATPDIGIEVRGPRALWRQCVRSLCFNGSAMSCENISPQTRGGEARARRDAGEEREPLA